MFSYNKASKVFVSHFFCFQGGPPQNEFGVALRPGVPSFAPSELGARTSANWRIPSHRYRTDSSFLLSICCGCLYLSACPPCIRLKTLKKGASLRKRPFVISFQMEQRAYRPLTTIFFVALKSPLRSS